MWMFAITATNITTIPLIVITIFILIIISLNVPYMFPISERPPPQSPPPEWNKATARLYRWTQYLSSSNQLNYINQERYPLPKTQFFYTPSPPTEKKEMGGWNSSNSDNNTDIVQFFKNFLHFSPKGFNGSHILYRSSPCFCFNVPCLSNFRCPPLSPPQPRIFGAQVTPNPGDLVLSFGCAYPATTTNTTQPGEAGSSGGAWAWTPWKKRPNVKNLW